MTSLYNVPCTALALVMVMLLLFRNLSSSPCQPACHGKNNVKFEQTCGAPPESFKFNLNQFEFYHYYLAFSSLVPEIAWLLSSICLLHVACFCCVLRLWLGFSMWLLEPFCIPQLIIHESKQKNHKHFSLEY